MEDQIPAQMKAIPFAFACKPEDLTITNWKTPTVGDDEVLVKVKAFGLNFADVFARKGQYAAAPPFPFVPGYEASGIVAAIGKNVDHVKVGDKVIAGCFNFGGYAEFATTIKEGVIPLPEGWNFSQGAASLVTSVTAYHALFLTGPLFPGDRVLIHAAAGGVGLAAVALALHKKCQIFGTCGSSEKVKLLQDKGVHHPINYREVDFETEVRRITNGEGVDVIIDSVGGKYFKKDINILRPNGRVVGIGASSTVDRSIGNLPSVISGVVSMNTISSIDLMLRSRAFYGVNIKEIADHRRDLLQIELKEIVSLFESGVLKPDVYQELPWEDIGKAHADLEGRKTSGKIVMTINE